MSFFNRMASLIVLLSLAFCSDAYAVKVQKFPSETPVEVPATSGTLIAGNCVKVGADGKSVADAGAICGGGAPTDATYITQTTNGTLSAEQDIASLATGILRGATTTGVITSLGDILPVANGGTGSATYATGTLLVGNNLTTLTHQLVGAAGASLMVDSSTTTKLAWIKETFPAGTSGITATFTGTPTDTYEWSLDINSLTADATPDSAVDYVATYDASAGVHKKVLLSNLPASAGDVTKVGDCASGACFDGTQGTSLIFNNAGGDGTFSYDGTSFDLNKPGTISGADPSLTWIDTTALEDDFQWIAGGSFLQLLNITDGVSYIFIEDTHAMTYGGATVPSHTFTTNSTGDGEMVLPADSIGPAEIDSTTGVYDFGGVTSFEIPNGTAPTVDAAGEIAQDTTNDQLLYGATPRVLTYLHASCNTIEQLAAIDDNVSIGATTYARTITQVGCKCHGTCTTKANIALEDDTGNAMTHTTPTCSAAGTVITYQAVTAANTLTAGEGLRFDVSNTPVPLTDTYDICVEYTVDRT